MLLERCPWYVAGPMLGALIVALRAAVNRPLGALGGYIDIVEHAGRPSRLGFSAFVLAGTALGGAVFALVTGGYSPTSPYDGLLPSNPTVQVAILATAGMAIGFGARTSGGCTSGHGLTGTSLGSPASIVAAMTFFTTAVLVAHLLTWLTGDAS